MVVRKPNGFALFELLVSVAIFALVAALAYGALDSIVRTRAQIEESSARLKALQIAVSVLDRDLAGAMTRAVRDGYGRSMPALVGGTGTIELSHSAALRVDGSLNAMIERVRYGVEKDVLVRRRFPVLDRASEQPPAPREMLDDTRELRLRYLDHAGTWRDDWPPRDGVDARDDALPRAVEYRLRGDDFGEITRRIVLPDGALLPVPVAPPA